MKDTVTPLTNNEKLFQRLFMTFPESNILNICCKQKQMRKPYNKS